MICAMSFFVCARMRENRRCHGNPVILARAPTHKFVFYIFSTVYDGVHHTPLGRFSKLDYSATSRVSIPNDTSSECSRRGVSNADLFWHRHCSNRGDMEHGKSAQGCVIYIVVYYIEYSLFHPFRKRWTQLTRLVSHTPTSTQSLQPSRHLIGRQIAFNFAHRLACKSTHLFS